MRPLAPLLATLLLVAAACGDDGGTTDTTDVGTPTTETEPQETTTSAEDGTTTTAAPGSPLPLAEGEDVVTGLDVPWGWATVDADTFLVTERPGVVRVIEDGQLRDEPVLEVDVAAQGEGGLLGLALHPDFPDVRSAYVYYTDTDGNRVSRFDVADDLTMSGEETIIDGIPAARIHDGGRVAFGPDGQLYVTTGDASEPQLAADLDSLAGKILRLAPDGSVPADNPFEGSPVWSYGHRNPQGLGWTSDGTMYATEHGPSGDLDLCCNDEINRIVAGGFYGWPFLAAEQPAAEGTPPAEPIPPVATSGPSDTWAPAGLAVVEHEGGDVLLAATLRSAELLRFDVVPDGLEPRGAVLDGLGRLRIATIGPDRCLYLGTSNTDGRGDPGPEDDRIIRYC